MAAQVAALPTELDASFARAMPMLRDGYISEEQSKNAKEILVASSLTYVVASLLAVLNIWPWLGAGPVRVAPQNARAGLLSDARCGVVGVAVMQPALCAETGTQKPPRRNDTGMLERLVRHIGKPLIRGWFQICRPLS